MAPAPTAVRPSPAASARARTIAVLMLLAVLIGACTSGGSQQDAVADEDPFDGIGGPFAELTAAEVQRQADADIAANPLGLVLDGCPIADAEAIEAIGTALGVADPQAGTVLNAVLQDPEATPGVQCALGYEGATEGAVVLNLRPGDGDVDAVKRDLVAAQFAEVDRTQLEDADLGDLPVGRVLLFDSTRFSASRAVYVGPDLQLGMTANQDLAGTGALLDALPVAVTQVARTIG